MEKMISNMMIINMNGEDHKFFSNSVNDSMLSSKTTDQLGELKKLRKRKSKNLAGENGVVSSSKRKLTDNQAARLELYFLKEPRLETERKERIADELGLEPRQVAVWFQNRRVRSKCKKMEDEFANLRTSHHSALAQNAQLETLVLELSGRLIESEAEILRLSARFEGRTHSYDNMTTTPSSISMDKDMVLHREVLQQLENDYVQMMDYYWMNTNMYDIM